MAADPKTYKDISISRVPISLIKQIEKDAEREHLSTSDIVRGVLLRHYGLLHERKNGQ